MSEPELSAVVTCFNGADRVPIFLPRLVDALRGVDARSEVILVDNGSVDGTAAVAEAAAPSASVIRVAPNRGASGGRNAGARAARAAWLLLCDDDVEVTRKSLSVLWAARRPGHCVVPLVRDLGGVLQNAVVSRWERGDHKLYELAEPVDEVAYPQGACLLVERDVYWAVGAFDERYQPNGYEDAAFGFALRRRGSTTYMVPQSTVTHHVHGEDAPEPGKRPRSVAAHRDEYRERIYRTRWLFALLVLRGWRRWMVVGLGLPRTMLQSVRLWSPGPVIGYCRGWRTFLDERRSSTWRSHPPE